MNWVKIAKLKTRQFKLNVRVSMALSIQITKFKFHQYKLRAILPNLMLSKVTRYTVVPTHTYMYTHITHILTSRSCVCASIPLILTAGGLALVSLLLQLAIHSSSSANASWNCPSCSRASSNWCFLPRLSE